MVTIELLNKTINESNKKQLCFERKEKGEKQRVQDKEEEEETQQGEMNYKNKAKQRRRRRWMIKRRVSTHRKMAFHAPGCAQEPLCPERENL